MCSDRGSGCSLGPSQRVGLPLCLCTLSLSRSHASARCKLSRQPISRKGIIRPCHKYYSDKISGYHLKDRWNMNVRPEWRMRVPNVVFFSYDHHKTQANKMMVHYLTYFFFLWVTLSSVCTFWAKDPNHWWILFFSTDQIHITFWPYLYKWKTEWFVLT